MRQYELVFILEPKLADKAQKEEISKLEKLITDLKGKVKKKEVWGKKNLAYPIKKFAEGIYVKFDLNFPQDQVREWERKMKLKTKIIRYLLIKGPDKS